MSPNFAPEQYLFIAQGLYTKKSEQYGEAAIRACMSRAYYAAFLTARDNATGDYSGGKDSHDGLINRYRTSSVAIEKSIGNHLYQLKRLRKKADYDIGNRVDDICTSKEGGESLRLSEKVLTAFGITLCVASTTPAPSHTP